MKVLVTGGGGFLGGGIVRSCLTAGHSVRVLARGAYPQLEEAGVELLRGDLADASRVEQAAQGCQVVFHVAARAGVHGRPRDFAVTNVLGTENVIAACRRAGVPRLVFTGSPSAVHAGGSLEGADESLPYPDRFHAPYPRTKARAERLVLGASDEQLATVSLRPHLIWGPGDRLLMPRLVARARARRLRLVGDGQNRVDSVYIDNAVAAHMAAAERLAPGNALAGRAYFITNGEPLPIAELINGILAAAGVAPVTRRISPRLALAVGVACEGVQRLLPSWEPPMTRFIAHQLSSSHWFDISAARRDLGYEPTISIREGLLRLAEWCQRGCPELRLACS